MNIILVSIFFLCLILSVFIALWIIIKHWKEGKEEDGYSESGVEMNGNKNRD